LGILKPGETKELDLYLYVIENEKVSIDEMWKNIENIRKQDVAREQITVEKYWKKYVKDHVGIELKEENSDYNRKFNQIFKRSILLFPLLTNKETGGVAAAVEVDENLSQ